MAEPSTASCSVLFPKSSLPWAGQNQSLATPDFSVPFHHFQFGLLETDPERHWSIHSEQDVRQFETALDSWLSSKAAPWFAQFETNEGLIEFMRQNGRFADLALLCQAQGNPAEARSHLISWISQLPRQIEKTLAKLLKAGLISEAEEAMLNRAALQSEDRYREMVGTWCTAPHPSP